MLVKQSRAHDAFILVSACPGTAAYINSGSVTGVHKWFQTLLYVGAWLNVHRQWYNHYRDDESPVMKSKDAIANVIIEMAVQHNDNAAHFCGCNGGNNSKDDLNRGIYQLR